MSEQRLKDARGSLAFSQGLLDRVRASQKPPEAAPQEVPPTPEPAAPEPVQAPVQQPVETPVEAPAEEAAPAEPEKTLSEKIEETMQGFFTKIEDFFKGKDKKDEETTSKIKGIEKTLKQIVEE